MTKWTNTNFFFCQLVAFELATTAPWYCHSICPPSYISLSLSLIEETLIYTLEGFNLSVDIFWVLERMEQVGKKTQNILRNLGEPLFNVWDDSYIWFHFSSAPNDLFFFKSCGFVHLRAKLYEMTCDIETDNTGVHDCHMTFI